jgi:hypothetical protein
MTQCGAPGPTSAFNSLKLSRQRSRTSAQNLSERRESHVGRDSGGPLHPGLICNPLLVVQKRLFIGKVDVPINGVSAVILPFPVECFQFRSHPNIYGDALHNPSVLLAQAIFKAGCGLLSDQPDLLPSNENEDNRREGC